MINNYIKTDSDTGSRMFFFNDRDEQSRRIAFAKALEVQPVMENLNIWRGDGFGRYQGEENGDPHELVTGGLSPISRRVRVIGVAFERKQQPSMSL
jgi:hypothetical protein